MFQSVILVEFFDRQNHLNVMDFDFALQVITAVSTTVAAVFVVGVFFYNRRQHRFDFIERSFDVLQRVNEKALESPENALAAIRSATPNDETDEDEAMLIYFHYMRINRIFRAYEYWNGGFITEEQRDRISSSQIKMLVPIKDKLERMLERGYPPDFHEWLLPLVKKETEVSYITAHEAQIEKSTEV